jgi:hypothetical protein
MPTSEAFGYQYFNLLPQQLFPPVFKQLFDLGVHQNDLAILVRYHHGIWSGLQQPAEFLLSPLAVSDIEVDPRYADRLARVVEEHRTFAQ